MAITFEKEDFEPIQLYRPDERENDILMGAGKTEKEEHLAEKIRDILDNDSVTDVRISSMSGERVVGIKFENSVEIQLRYCENLEFSHFKISNTGPGKVLAQSPTFEGTNTDTDIITLCYHLLETEKGNAFVEQVGRYFEAFEDDRVEFS